jgi:GxxExxY protein
MTDIKLTAIVIGYAIEVHWALGPGLLERVYQECLYYKLAQEGLSVEKEKPIPVIFEGVKLWFPIGLVGREHVSCRM